MPTPAPLSHLGDMPIETFIAEYWHKKPLLIRNAFVDLQPPLSADELAGMACEPEVESRLLIETPQTGAWQLQHGPFDEAVFADLPEQFWTLLVQGVDHWVPEAADFLEQFRFIPSWRLDDLMISYAAKGGGVGPHYDNYDVFLLQVEGQRRWEIGGLYDQDSECLEDKPVRILKHWQAEQSWVLNPGDMLYLPPRVGHNGVAETDGCVTYSIGYRAAQNGDMLAHFASFCAQLLKDTDRYADPDLSLRSSSGEICHSDLQRVQSLFRDLVEDRQQLARWFGRFVTEPKYPELSALADGADADEGDFDGAGVDEAGVDEAGVDEAEQALRCLSQDDQARVRRGEGVRFAYCVSGELVQLFVDGHSFDCPPAMLPLVRLLSDQNEFSAQQLRPWLEGDGGALLRALLRVDQLYLC